jgi:hypothetical protein
VVPVEGYYAEDQELNEYFSLMRALQSVREERSPMVASLTEFQRLLDIASAPLYGKPIWSGFILPSGLDALSQALFETQPSWSGQRLTEAAFAAATKMDDFSLVGLAALAQDPVVLTATRESVVLYAAPIVGAAMTRPKYVWGVDKELAEQARRFILVFRTLFETELPPAEPHQAERYWHACVDNKVFGRCVRLGYNDVGLPVLQYHWAICRGEDDSLVVQEFWHQDVWTTERYRAALRKANRALVF